MADTIVTLFINGKEETIIIPNTMSVTTIPVGDTTYASIHDIPQGYYFLPQNAGPSDTPLPISAQRYLFVKDYGVSQGGTGVCKTQEMWSQVPAAYAISCCGSAGGWGGWWSSATVDSNVSNITTTLNNHTGNRSNPHGVTIAQIGAAPANIILGEEAGTNLLPSTGSGTIQSKIQSLRNNVKYLLNTPAPTYFPTPTTAATIGQWSRNLQRIGGLNQQTGWALPPGGTWAYSFDLNVPPNTGQTTIRYYTGVAGGGTIIAAGRAGLASEYSINVGFCWRIA